MAFYRCGGANHYDEGYNAGYTAGYNRGYPAGKSYIKNLTYAETSVTALRDTDADTFTATFPWRVDAFIDATCYDENGSFSGGISNVRISGNTVYGWLNARFFPDGVTIKARHYYALD